MVRGRKPKPTEVKLATGNPGRRPVRAGVASVQGDPEVPPHLTGEALAEWGRVTADMRAMRTLGHEVRAVLAIYCQNWARMLESEAHVSEHGAVVPAPRTGVPMHNPHLAIANRAADVVARLASELGLTPSSRTRVGATGNKTVPDSPWNAFSVIDGGKTQKSSA